MNKFWSFFSSMKLAVVLMILIAIVASIGTFIPQNQTPEYYTENYAELGKFFLWLGFDNFYSAPIFTFLLAMLFVNTLVCTIARIGKVWKDSFSFDFSKASGKFSGPFSGIYEGGVDSFISLLKRKGFAAKQEGKVIVAKKSRWARIGPDIVHIGLLLIILSGIVVGFTTKSHRIFITEGDSFTVEGVEITLEKFIFERYADGSPKDWISVVRFLDNDIERTFNIEVNKPLTIGNAKIYQASYRNNWEIALEIVKGGEHIATLSGKAGDMFKFEGYDLYTSQFFPDLKVDSHGHVFSASDQPNNPAIYVEYYIGPTFAARQWVFRDFEHDVSPETFPYKAVLGEFSGPFYETGLNIIHSKGNSLVFVALVVISFGLSVALYGRFIQVYARFEEGKVAFKIVPHRNSKDMANELLNEIMQRGTNSA